MTRVTQSGPGIAGKRVGMSYDAASQMTGVMRFVELAGTRQVASSNYGYANAGRLTELTHTHAGTTRHLWLDLRHRQPHHSGYITFGPIESQCTDRIK